MSSGIDEGQILRFKIKDLLMITLIAALAALAFRSYVGLSELRAEIAEAQSQTQTVLSTTQRLSSQMTLESATLDFSAQVDKAYQPALAGFADVQKRYGTIDPKPDKASVRSVPIIRQSKSQSPIHYRVWVPERSTVFAHEIFLRCAVAARLTGRNRHKLDSQDWIETRDLSHSAKSQILLAPGMHDLSITIHRSRSKKDNAMIEVTLDGQPLIQCETQQAGRNISSWSSSKLDEQHNINFRHGTRSLVTAMIDNPKSQSDLEFWIWLSHDKDTKGFIDFPLIQTGETDE